MSTARERKKILIRMIILFCVIAAIGFFLPGESEKDKRREIIPVVGESEEQEDLEKIHEIITKKETINEEEQPSSVVDFRENVNSEKKEDQGDRSFSDEIAIKTPFTVQAPFGVWDQRHKEACEEASLLMVEYFLTGRELTPEVADKEIQRMIDFEIEKYGDYQDSDAAGLVQLAKDFYQLDNLSVVYDFSLQDLKRVLAKGKPIIIPAAGRELGNPFFTSPGPLYHMLVLTGYEGGKIITNDPGTKRGEAYRYNEDILYNAIHDFPGSRDDILQGRKAMVVVQE